MNRKMTQLERNELEKMANGDGKQSLSYVMDVQFRWIREYVFDGLAALGYIDREGERFVITKDGRAVLLVE